MYIVCYGSYAMLGLGVPMASFVAPCPAMLCYDLFWWDVVLSCDVVVLLHHTIIGDIMFSYGMFEYITLPYTTLYMLYYGVLGYAIIVCVIMC